MEKKILLVGSHSCSNRGDMAILRGLVETIKSLIPQAIMKIYSREFESSDVLFNEHDLSYDVLQGEINSFKDKIKSRLEMIILFLTYLALRPLSKYVLSQRQRKFYNELDEFDYVIQVGGSFLVDSYGINQFEYILISLVKGRKIYLLGHSYGPYRSIISKLIAKTTLKKVEKNFYRETPSKKILLELGIKNIDCGADTAWLVKNNRLTSESKENTIALTLRDLYPFDKVLGISQSTYELKVVNLINMLNTKGYRVKIFSTCTGFGGYWKDDRVIGYKVQKRVSCPSMVDVIKDEIDDVELGHELQKCILTIGTRLHSAIISMNFGTPAFTIYYEHKSLGIIERLLSKEYCLDIKKLDEKETLQKIQEVIQNIDEVKAQLNTNVLKEKEIGLEMIRSVLSNKEV